jgi:hypothetical protein
VAKTMKAKKSSAGNGLWKTEPEEHDYPAAYDYLTLMISEKQARGVVSQLRKAPISHRKAKDILRASSLQLLSSDNSHVAKDMRKVETGTLLSPVLLMRAGINAARPLVVADGYHRICASHHLDENLDIPCRIADLLAR